MMCNIIDEIFWSHWSGHPTVGMLSSSGGLQSLGQGEKANTVMIVAVYCAIDPLSQLCLVF